MKLSIRRLSALTAGVALAVASSVLPANAAVQYEWVQVLNTVNPTIYQTNLWYTSANLTPPATVTNTSGTIVQTYHQWQVYDGPGTRGTLQVQACTVTTNLCADITFTPVYSTLMGYKTYTADGWSTAFAGLPANTSFYYRYRLNATLTKVLASPIQSLSHRINVDWEAGS